MSDALLDEVIAGCEANAALLQRGSAHYATERWEYAIPASDIGGASRGANTPAASHSTDKRGPFRSEHTVYFDYPRMRFDWRGNGVSADDPSEVVNECYIVDGRRTITHNLPQFFEKNEVLWPPPDRRVSNPNAHNVLIDAMRSPPRRMMHPRQQLPRRVISDGIRALRKKPGISLKAHRQTDGLVCFVVDGPQYVAKYWLSPREGYCVVASKSWNPHFPEPAAAVEEYDAVVRAVGDAFVIERRRTKSAMIFDGKMVLPQHEEHVTLATIDLSDPPDEKLFTLDGLDIPAGTPIQDRVEGRTYTYAVAAVNERDVKVPTPAGAARGRQWTMVFYIAIGIGLLAIGFVSYRMRPR